MKVSGLGLERTGVIAGMSGSPVYLDGKLAGAVSATWAFGKDPVGQVTPIENMLEAGSRRRAVAPGAPRPRHGVRRRGRVGRPRLGPRPSARRARRRPREDRRAVPAGRGPRGRLPARAGLGRASRPPRSRASPRISGALGLPAPFLASAGGAAAAGRAPETGGRSRQARQRRGAHGVPPRRRPPARRDGHRHARRCGRELRRVRAPVPRDGGDRAPRRRHRRRRGLRELDDVVQDRGAARAGVPAHERPRPGRLGPDGPRRADDSRALPRWRPPAGAAKELRWSVAPAPALFPLLLAMSTDVALVLNDPTPAQKTVSLRLSIGTAAGPFVYEDVLSGPRAREIAILTTIALGGLVSDNEFEDPKISGVEISSRTRRASAASASWTRALSARRVAPGQTRHRERPPRRPARRGRDARRDAPRSRARRPKAAPRS